MTIRDSKPWVIGITPLEYPDASLVRALVRSGAFGVLDLGRDPALRVHMLLQLARSEVHEYGVRIPEGCAVDPTLLPGQVTLVILPSPQELSRYRPRTVFVQVTSLEEARLAASLGADGLIAKGAESGGRVGEKSAFVLVQQLLAELDLPIWVQGGIGLHTASACMAAGAAGVVLDSQLALLRESKLPAFIKAVLSSMDGSETTVIANQRVYFRPDLPVAEMAEAESQDVIAKLGFADLRKNLLPVGQDAALSKPLSRDFRGVYRLIEALNEAIPAHLRAAKNTEPLAPASPLAAELDIRFPIVQGPMSRVSDRPEFAAAVAENGALPCLALGLLHGEELDSLLQETRALLGERPFGVGILGFAPAELWEEQIRALLAFRPSFAVLAGGRPAQARQLESMGIETYLHVPSPGLLDMFLAEGLRRFILEGRECGGHVGPRFSFVLWESLIERMMRFDRPEELRVLFAGGIHDARSAAMIAAMAALLVEQGARIGVLMGSAYLFTEEAVATGALLPGFQEVALSCEQTAEVETGPGHVTRCADTEYANLFLQEKDRLLGLGKNPKEIWLALEQLNLGRLRLAAKGLLRQGEDLVSMDDAAQRSQGMYMIGQLAALRKSVVRMEDLHLEVSEGSRQWFESIQVEDDQATAISEAESAQPVDIAIVGMAGLFGGSKDLAEFWASILEARNCITEVPRQRWNPDEYFDPTGDPRLAGVKTPSKWGGFLPAVRIDPLFYGIVPKSMTSIEPVQLLSLEVARRALVDAGYEQRPFERDRAAVIFGAESGTDLAAAYGFRALGPRYLGKLPEELDQTLPRLTEDSFAGILSNIIAGRIANRLDLRGVNCTVDAACASSLAALNLGIKELVSGSSDMVLCGGADVHNSVGDYLLFSSVHALSARDRCSPFDAQADGTVLGEGVGCLVLKRLADAERDGDRVYAVIKGIGCASDGKSLGLTAPRKEGQKLAMTRAYQQAGISPSQVGLLEAHGTGTVVGDRIELEALTEIYAEAGATRGSCVLGSVKSQIGHTKCAAGLAALIKVALSLYHGVLPATLHIQKPNAGYDPAQSPFIFHTSAQPWVSGKRVAALSAFGFGGANFHAVLSAYDGSECPAPGVRPCELFLFRGERFQDALSRMEAICASLQASPDSTLRGLAQKNASQGQGPVQVAIVASDLADLSAKLEQARARAADPNGVFIADGKAARGKVAFVYPGQGSQRPGMLAQLFVHFPALRRALAEGEDVMGADLLKKVFPGAAFSSEERNARQEALTDTRVAQPALGMVELALTRLLVSLGLSPDMTAGHSYGELVALCAAGVIEETDLLPLSQSRAECMLGQIHGDPGTMLAVTASGSEIEKALGGPAALAALGITLANQNSPRQCVISGDVRAIEQATRRLEQASLVVSRLNVACAFHSPRMEQGAVEFAARLERVSLRAGTVPVYANLTAAEYPTEAGQMRRVLSRQLCSPVRFQEQIEAMYGDGARIFVEVGPARVLTGLIRNILGDRGATLLACDGDAGQGLWTMLCTIGKLAVLGVPIRAQALFEQDEPMESQGALPARSASSDKTAWWVNGHTAWPMVGEPPMGSLLRIQTARWESSTMAAKNEPQNVTRTETRTETRPADAKDQVMQDFLSNMRDIASMQREVMMQYLGQAPAVQAPAVQAQALPAVAAVQPAIAPIDFSAQPKPAAVLPAPTLLLPSALPVASLPEAPAAKPDLLECLLAIVSERTGYPLEMLDLDLDLEADLSIDSIKRIEILGELSKRLGFAASADESEEKLIEQLATKKTLRSIVQWLESQTGAPPPVEAPAEALPAPQQAAQAKSLTPIETQPADSEVERYVFGVSEVPAAVRNGLCLQGKTLALTDDGKGVARSLCNLLLQEGAAARVLAEGEELGQVDGLIHLASLSGNGNLGSSKGAFSLTKEALQHGATLVLAATGFGGDFGKAGLAQDRMPSAGIAGLIKTIAQERTDVHSRVVDMNSAEAPEKLAQHMFDELFAGHDENVEVGYRGELRYVRQIELRKPGAPCRKPVELNENSVILVTGGARGITARVARELAQRFRCRLELVGRSSLNEFVDAELEAARDMVELRKLLVQRGETQPARIEARGKRILAQREIRKTLRDLEALGAKARYHALDVRDEKAFSRLLDDLYARYGRIDGVIHGAGILEDKLIGQKSEDSFARVYDTKVQAASVLSRKLRRDVQFVVFFSSIASVFGNRGQIDYAAANDALDRLATWLGQRVDGRVVSINWGPWAETGMVTPELERAYHKRGIGLILPDQGVETLLEEILHSSDKTSQVIIMSGRPDRLVANKNDNLVEDAA